MVMKHLADLMEQKNLFIKKKGKENHAIISSKIDCNRNVKIHSLKFKQSGKLMSFSDIFICSER